MPCPFKETCETKITNDDFIKFCQSTRDAFESCFYYPSQILRKIPREWDEK